MHWKTAGIVFFIILLVNSIHAQLPDGHYLLDKMSEAAAKIDQGQYVLHYKLTKIRGNDSGTTMSTANCYFRKMPSDMVTGYALASFASDSVQYIYDGHALFIHRGDSLEVRRADKDQRVFWFIVGEFFRKSLPYRINMLLNFRKASKDSLQVIGLEDVNGDPCYKVRPVYSNALAMADGSDYQEWCYISSTSFLPVRWVSQMKIGRQSVRTVSRFDYSITDLRFKKVRDKVFTKAALDKYYPSSNPL